MLWSNKILSYIDILTNRDGGSWCWVGDHKVCGPKNMETKKKWVGKKCWKSKCTEKLGGPDKEDESMANLRFFSLDIPFFIYI